MGELNPLLFLLLENMLSKEWILGNLANISVEATNWTECAAQFPQTYFVIQMKYKAMVTNPL